MNYLRIDKEDICNGEGLRVVLWLSGCSHKCKGCQNPQTWDANRGVPFDESAKEELFRELDKDYISGLTLSGGDPLFESNLDDVLKLVTEVNKRYNAAQYIDTNNHYKHNILNINANEIRLSSPKKSVWLYTGFTYEEIMKYEYGTSYINNVNCEALRQAIFCQCDVVVDGKYIDSKRDLTLQYRGSDNQRLIDIQRSLQKGEIVLWQV